MIPRIVISILVCLGIVSACVGRPDAPSLEARPYPVAKSKVVAAVAATMQELGFPLDRVNGQGETVTIVSKAGADSYVFQVIVMQHKKTTLVQPQVFYHPSDREKGPDPMKSMAPDEHLPLYRNFFAKLEEHLERMKSWSR